MIGSASRDRHARQRTRLCGNINQWAVQTAAILYWTTFATYSVHCCTDVKLALGQRQDEAGEAARAGEAITAARLRDQWERHFADDKRGSRAAATAQVRCWNWRGALLHCLPYNFGRA